MNFYKTNCKGIENEIKFAQVLDNKMIKDLPIKYQKLLYGLFEDINEYDYVECWKSKFFEKADIKIRINDNIKGVSIKMGECNSVHQESLDSFIIFLMNMGITKKVTDILSSYIKGTVNGEKVEAAIYRKMRYNEIEKLKTSFSDFYIKTNLFIRFLFKGKDNWPYTADAIIHGTPDNFIWATKSEILKYLLNYSKSENNNVKIGPLFIQSYHKKLHEKTTNSGNEIIDIQIKWYSLAKDLEKISLKRNKMEEI